jgi:hypothetical protein
LFFSDIAALPTARSMRRDMLVMPVLRRIGCDAVHTGGTSFWILAENFFGRPVIGFIRETRRSVVRMGHGP